MNEQMDFARALKQLQQLIEALEQQQSLEKSLELYEQGITLVKACEVQLANARQRVEHIQRDKQGSITSTDASELP